MALLSPFVLLAVGIKVEKWLYCLSFPVLSFHYNPKRFRVDDAEEAWSYLITVNCASSTPRF